MRFRTKQIHAGVQPDPTTGAILTPIHQSTTFVQPSVDEYLATGYSYSRSSNPTVRAWEEKITALEDGADAAAFATGMAAISAVFMTFLNAGDHAVVSDVAYGGTYRLATTIFSSIRGGLLVRRQRRSRCGQTRQFERITPRWCSPRARPIPTLKYTDIAAVSEIARGARRAACGGQHLPHPLLPAAARPRCRPFDPLDHEVPRRSQRHRRRLCGVGNRRAPRTGRLYVQNATGTIMSPQVAWLTLQGVKTLSERMDRQSDNAHAGRPVPRGPPQGHHRSVSRVSSRSPSTTWPNARHPGSAP